jgi:hypothetical protein
MGNIKKSSGSLNHHFYFLSRLDTYCSAKLELPRLWTLTTILRLPDKAHRDELELAIIDDHSRSGTTFSN